MGMLGEGKYVPAISCKQVHILMKFWYMVRVQDIAAGNLLQFIIFHMAQWKFVLLMFFKMVDQFTSDSRQVMEAMDMSRS